MKLKFIILSGLLFFTGVVQAQVKKMLEDTATLALISKGLQLTYNFQFEESKEVYNEIVKRYPGHPAYAQLMVMHQLVKLGLEANEKNIKENWEKQYSFLQMSLEQSKALLDENEDGIEGIFFMLNTRSFLAYYYAENRQKVKAIGEAQKAYKYFKKAIVRKDEYKEFYFASGIYNYYIERYPQIHPIIKPFMMFFKSGSMELGLEELKIASKESVYSATEALAYLVHIYGKYEAQYDSSLKYSNILVEKFPENLNFLVKHAEQLVLKEKYHELNPYLKKLWETGDSTFFKMSAYIFKGLELEKAHTNYKKAKKMYDTALGIAKAQDIEDYDYPLLAFAGLARIAIANKDTEAARRHYQYVLKEAEYPALKKEAEIYLQKH